jgi:ASPIC and UnbV
VTTSTGTGHLQKGHGVAFADWDRDGDVDVFLESGGATPGDKAGNLLFQNPGHGRHWLNVKLIGVTTNRSALGARISLRVREADGTFTPRHRVVTSGSSFGGNPLATTIGLGRARDIATLKVDWPTSKTEQVFRNIPVDRALEITEGETAYRILDWTPTPLPEAH